MKERRGEEWKPLSKAFRNELIKKRGAMALIDLLPLAPLALLCCVHRNRRIWRENALPLLVHCFRCAQVRHRQILSLFLPRSSIFASIFFISEISLSRLDHSTQRIRVHKNRDPSNNAFETFMFQRRRRKGRSSMPTNSADTSMTEETESLLTTVPLDIENGGGGNGIGGAKSAPPPPTPPPPQSARADALRLIFGAGGIYAAFLYYGSLQEDVFRYTSEDGTAFDQAWFLQFLEALANVCVGFLGMKVAGSTKNIPQKFFIISGASQVSSKAFTSLSLARGLSFPVATLAKSGKMAPVMAGQLLLGGASYSTREYLQVAAIIGGTAILSMGKKVRWYFPSRWRSLPVLVLEFAR